MLTFNFNKINVNPEGTMLDLGCGEGRHIFGVMEQFPDLKCIGLDPHIESLEKAKEGLEFLESISNRKTSFLSGSAYSLPFNDNSFDVIFCNHVLEHVQDDTKAMKELFRVMKKGGMGIFQVPQDLNRDITFEDNSITDPKERAKIFGQYDHVRVYGRDYFDKLRSIGFNVEEVNYSQKISSELLSRYRLMEGELLPVVFKN